MLSFILCWLLAASFLGAPGAASSSTSSTRPNIILIMSDDQDKLLNSLDYQPSVIKQFMQKGATFNKHFCTMAQCCPSRVSLLTGKAGHNTNVTDVIPPYGGYPKFVSQGLNSNYLPIWLQAGGYNTYYVGKFMNSHSVTNYNNPYPAGWNGTDFLIEPNIYWYYNATWQRNKDAPYLTPGQYSTDLISQKALGYLEDAVGAADGRPFFMGILPIGPHAQVRIFPDTNATNVVFEAPVPADRHTSLYPGVKVPRKPNFNPDVPGQSSYFKTLPKLNDTIVSYLDDLYRKRLQALASIDEMIDAVFAKLDKLGITNNTYVIYTADNGYHIGQHRMQAGKTTCYEEDVNIPFMIRGPGIQAGVTYNFPTTHTDLAPTILSLAGIPLRPDFDGTPIPVTGNMSLVRPEQVNIEFWGSNREEGIYAPFIAHPNNTYKTVRLIGTGYDLMYTVWCTNEHELYDMKLDPSQMNNLYNSNSTYLYGYPVPTIVSRLNGLMMVMKSCKGSNCTYPWKVIHPQGDVNSFVDALNPKFDSFYANQMPKVMYDMCALGYIVEVEGPQTPASYSAMSKRNAIEDDFAYKKGDAWEMWT